MNRHNNERGIALVLSLFLMTAMSVLGVSLMFLSQTETYASMNYRMMSQARYAGEAGVQKAANFLLDTTQYAPPGTVADPLSAYNRTVSPVTRVSNGQPVILSADPDQASNYPVSAVQTAFNTAGQGTLMADNVAVTYKSFATLVAMQVFELYGGGQAVVQTWQITSGGTVSGPREATVEVGALVEAPKVSANSYAAFATANTCGAIYFHGNVTVNSYDSSLGPPTGAGNSTLSSGGDVGTNGNLHIQGSVDVWGNLYTPRTGVGSCSSGAVTALSETGSADVNGSVIQLPTAVSYPIPAFSATPPTTAVTINAALVATGQAAACASLGLIGGTNCRLNPGVSVCPSPCIAVDGAGFDVTMPSVTVAGGYTLALSGHASPSNVVNINALNGSGDVQVNHGANEAVVLKIAGKNADGTDMTTPFDLSVMAWKQNASDGKVYDASAIQIVYGGPANISMKGGNSQSAATIYAPNASFTLQGTQDLYGSVLARTITNGGNASIHYDRRLAKDFYVAGHPMMGTFTWKRY